jgi:hypothetical protein
MRRLLFIDRIDGTLPLKKKKIGEYLLRLLVEAYAECFTPGKAKMTSKHSWRSEIDPGGLLRVGKKYGLTTPVLLSVQRLLREDKYSRAFGNIFRTFKNADEKKYCIVSRPLREYLSNIRLDITMDCIPDNFAAYFESSDFHDDDGSTVVCGFVVVSNYPEKEFLIGLVTTIPEAELGAYALRTLHIPYFPDRKLEDVYREHVHEAPIPKHESELLIAEGHQKKFSESEALRTMINMALYSINPTEKWFEQANEFSKKESKRRGQEKVYTQKPFIELGFKDSEFLRLIVKKEVDPYWKRQHYGPGNSLRRPQLISGYTKGDQSKKKKR